MQQFASAHPNANPDYKYLRGSSGTFVDLNSINRVLNDVQNQNEQRITEVNEDESDNEVASFHDQEPTQQDQEEGGLPAHLRDPNFSQMGSRALRGATPSKSPEVQDYSEEDDAG
jgi:hypothetical protein